MTTLEEVLALPLDAVEDHDYFAIKRQERLDRINAQKQERERELRAVRRRQLEAGWKEDGEAGMRNMKSSVNFLKFILGPHNNMKTCFQHLFQNVESATIRYQGKPLLLRHCATNSIKILLEDIGSKRKRKMLSKSRLILYKFTIMRDLKSYFLLNRPSQWEYRKSPPNLIVARHLLRSHMRLVQLDSSTHQELTKRRATLKTAVAKLDLIHRTMDACSFVLQCDSAQHKNPDGCSRCGVVYMGGMLDGGTMYVKSISRDSGVATLVTLDFEIETLNKEEAIQLRIVDELKTRCDSYEEIVLHHVLTTIQQWAAFVFAFRRCQKSHARQQRSLYYYRIRRLVVLKREIDALIPEAAPIDLSYFEHKYWDIMREMKEYVALQTQLKEQRIRKWADLFRRKLHVLVEEGRERRYQEWLRLQSIPPPPKPLVFKTIEERPLLQEFVCFRLECKMRKFISKDRFDIHMAVHRRTDVTRYRQYEQQREQQKQRLQEEKQFLVRVKQARAHVLMQEQDEEAALYSNDNAAVALVPYSGTKSGIWDNDVGSSESAKSSGSYFNTMIVPETNYHIGAGAAFAATAAAVGSTEFDGIVHHSSSTALLIIDAAEAVDQDSNPTDKQQQQQLVVFDASTTVESVMDHERHIYNHVTNFDPSVHLQHLHGDQAMRNWRSIEHVYALNAQQNTAMYSLELVSKQGDVDAPLKVPLDRPVVRVGTHSSCELCLVPRGRTKKDGKIAKVHCLFYCPMYDSAEVRSPQQRGQQKKQQSTQQQGTQSSPIKTLPTGSSADTGTDADLSNTPIKDLNTDLTIVDNHSAWGTYVVSSEGTRKVPSKVTAGVQLQAGLLVCLGVCLDGPSSIPPTLANQACVVYRIRCIDREEHA